MVDHTARLTPSGQHKACDCPECTGVRLTAEQADWYRFIVDNASKWPNACVTDANRVLAAYEQRNGAR